MDQVHTAEGKGVTETPWGVIRVERPMPPWGKWTNLGTGIMPRPLLPVP